MSKNKRSAQKRSTLPTVESIRRSPSNAKRSPRLVRDNSFAFVCVSRLFFFVFLYWFWAIRYQNFLYSAQNFDVFLWDFSFLEKTCASIGGTLGWASSFVVQFFYYPALGGLILASLLLGVQILTASFFRLRGRAVLWSFLVPLTTSAAITQVNYYLFEAFDVAFLFGIILAVLGVLAVGVLFQRIVSPNKRLLFVVVATFVLYPISGFFALFAAFLCLVQERTFSFDSRRNLRCEIMFLAALASPLCWFPFFASSNSFFSIFVAGLVEESVIDKDVSTLLLFYGLYWGTLLLLLALSLREPLASKLFQKSPTFDLNQNRRENDGSNVSPDASPVAVSSDVSTAAVSSDASAGVSSRRSSCVRWGSQENILTAIVVVFCVGTVWGSFFPQNFQVLLKAGRLLEEKRWNEILTLEASVPFPINPLSSLRTLALIKTNQFADRFFERPLNPKVSVPLMSVGSFKMLGDRVLFEHGHFNLATRTAMNNFADKDERSLWATKTLALCAVGQNETELADKYLRRIEKTLFHRSWAKRYRDYLQRENGSPEPTAANDSSEANAETVRGSIAENVQKVADEFQTIQKIAVQEDYTSNVMALDYVVYFGYQQQNFENRSAEQKANQLTVLLILMDMDRFFAKLDSFLASNGDRPVPGYIQQAVLFDSYFIKKKGVETTRCPISPETLDRFRKFVAISAELKRNPNREKACVKELDQKFADTLWYHQIFAKNMVNY